MRRGGWQVSSLVAVVLQTPRLQLVGLRGAVLVQQREVLTSS